MTNRENVKEKEKFIDVKGFPGYEVSNFGKVISHWKRIGLGRNRGTKTYISQCTVNVLRPVIHKGYPMVTLVKDRVHFNKYVHTLILEAFVGPRPPLHHSRHIDGNKTNSILSNLSWGTPSENASDTKRHGRTLFGERNKSAKLTEEQVHQIRILSSQGVPQRKLAKMFAVSQASIWYIKHRVNWSHLP